MEVIYLVYMFCSLLFFVPAAGTPWAKAGKGEGIPGRTGLVTKTVQADMKGWVGVGRLALRRPRGIHFLASLDSSKTMQQLSKVEQPGHDVENHELTGCWLAGRALELCLLLSLFLAPPAVLAVSSWRNPSSLHGI